MENARYYQEVVSFVQSETCSKLYHFVIIFAETHGRQITELIETGCKDRLHKT